MRKMKQMGQTDMFGVLTETHEDAGNAYANTPTTLKKT